MLLEKVVVLWHLSPDMTLELDTEPPEPPQPLVMTLLMLGRQNARAEMQCTPMELPAGSIGTNLQLESAAVPVQYMSPVSSRNVSGGADRPEDMTPAACAVSRTCR